MQGEENRLVDQIIAEHGTVRKDDPGAALGNRRSFGGYRGKGLKSGEESRLDPHCSMSVFPGLEKGVKKEVKARL